MADGQSFFGGDKEIAAVLFLGKEFSDEVKPWKAKARFDEGEIKADLILGYPWLAQNGLDVLTREGCLGLRMGNKCYTITDCPEIEQWDDVPLIDTRPIQQIECNARRSEPKRLWARCPAWLNCWESAQVAHIEGRAASQPLGWPAPPPPVSFSPEAQEALVACIQDNKRNVYVIEADAIVEAFLPLDEVPKQSFSVPGDDEDEHDHLDNVEK